MTLPVDDLGRVRVKSLNREGLESWLASLGVPAYRGRQVFGWLYGKSCRSFAAMTNLPASLRDELGSKAVIEGLDVVTEARSTDGSIKHLLELSSGARVEAVLIPDFRDDGSVNRMTVCVSSQVGCAMGCTFCATGRMGFMQDLSMGEIVDQVLLMNDLATTAFGTPVSNVVFMGMGEPLLNYSNVLDAVETLGHADSLGMSARRFTVSTVGLAKMIQRLADDGTRFNLAISLHAPVDAKRSEIMPVNRSQRTDLKALGQAVRYYYSVLKRPVTYEYCMLRGFNDSTEDAVALAAISSWAPSKVNLIMYNPVEGTGFDPTPEKELDAFIRVLVDRGVTVTVRRSRGQDIAAACGQLATYS